MGVPEVISALNEPAKKLIDAVSNAIGKAYEPHHKRKMADATAYEIDKIGKAIRDNCDMPIIYNPDGTLQIDTSNYEELIKRTGARLAFQEVAKQNNIESVVDKAYDILEQENEVSAEPVDQDWMIRFMNSIEDVSNEQMQEIWGKILAGEIKQPNSYSLRTLNVLKNLSQKEAELFSKMASYFIDDAILSDKKILNRFGFTYEDILRLDDCGLISSRGISFQQNITKDNTPIFWGNGYILMCNTIEKNKPYILGIGIYPLTSAGKELNRIIDANTAQEYIFEYARNIKNTNKGVNISLHSITSSSDKGIKFDGKDLLSEKENEE